MCQTDYYYGTKYTYTQSYPTYWKPPMIEDRLSNIERELKELKEMIQRLG